ncbi:MAG TPA: ABC transporter ATP-binding protein [Blastocatellia bacterium]|nr:ABC transporter ATP-binding protein [Blastocatellia bacterium]
MVEVSHVFKTHRREDGSPVEVLKDATMSVTVGEFVAIRGPSGSGKSSLLNILGCLDKPTSGTYLLDGKDVSGYSDRKLSLVRSRKIGFVFQSFNLLPKTTAVENVEMPMIYAGTGINRKRALRALERVGLKDRARHYGTELSGGEQQRVAIARALINNPPLILADEPTGNLDSVAAADIMNILQELNLEGRTILLVTHDDSTAAYARRQVFLKDGSICS